MDEESRRRLALGLAMGALGLGVMLWLLWGRPRTAGSEAGEGAAPPDPSTAGARGAQAEGSDPVETEATRKGGDGGACAAPAAVPDLALEMPGPAPEPTPPAPPRVLRQVWLEAAAATHPGQVRTTNEDRFLLETWGSQAVLAAVADGLGGHGGGDVAAHIAVQGLRRCLERPLPPGDPERYEALLQSLYGIDDAIHRRGGLELGRGAMGTTVVLALLTPDRGLHAHAGDSRLYLYRDGARVLQTRDHTIVQVLLENGQIRPEDVATHPMRNQLTSCLGGAGSPGSLVVEPAWNEEGGEQPAALHPRPGDLVLLCSDGLCGEIPPEALDDLVGVHGHDPGKLAGECIRAALEAGGRDNVTVVALRYLTGDAAG